MVAESKALHPKAKTCDWNPPPRMLEWFNGSEDTTGTPWYNAKHVSDLLS